MLEIFGSASPEVITTFYIPRKAPRHLYITCIFVFKLCIQFLNSCWVFANEAVRFEEEIALAVMCVSLDGIMGPRGAPTTCHNQHGASRSYSFWSDLSWSRADLCSNSYVISTRFSLLSTLPSCTRYISYVGTLRIIHNVLFRIIHLYDNELGPTDFQLTCYCSYFLIFE